MNKPPDFLQNFGVGEAGITLPPGGERAGGPVKILERRGAPRPDALPALAVAGCFASGTTRLVNVPQARIKETDRLAVMRQELQKMGGRLRELPDGLVIQGGALRGAPVDGHDDHRVVMALAVAGLAASGRTEVSGAEAAAVTFPTFIELMTALGARIRQA